MARRYVAIYERAIARTALIGEPDERHSWAAASA